MSSIEITGIDSRVTEKHLKLTFYEFGKIESIEYNKCEPKKCSGKAKIIFKNKTAAKQALEYNETFIYGHKIHIITDENHQIFKKNEKLFSFTDIALILFVAIISFAVHFPKLDFPKEVVFDETHFGGYISGYITGVRFFDIHPPLSKLILAAWAKYACNYTGNFNFSTFSYNDQIDYVKIRSLPCFCGSMVAPILTASMLLRRCSYASSFMTGMLFALDFTSIVQSRFILTDSMVYFFVSMTIFFTCLLPRKDTTFVALMGGLFGSAAFCSKFAAGGALFLVAIANIRLCIRKKHGFFILCVRGASCVIILFSMLFVTIYIHLILTPTVGYGDRYTAKDFRQKSYPMQCLLLLWDMYRYNRDITFDHPYQSKWYEWPTFQATPTLLWSKNRLAQSICILNNPISAFSSLIGAIMSARWLNLEWFLTWCVSYFPFAAVTRCTWTYHYEIPLIFGICGFSFALDRLPKHFRRGFYTFTLCSLIAAFYFWMPWLYGIEIPRGRLYQMTIWERTRFIWGLE